MKRDKVIEYVLLITLCIVASFSLFLVDYVKIQKIMLTIFLIIYSIMIIKLLKVRKIDNKNKKSIIISIICLSAIYVMILYLIGIFIGFYSNLYRFSLKRLVYTIIPYIIIVVCSELIRHIFITKDDKKIIILLTIGLILVDIATYIEFYSVFSLSKVLELIGYIIIPSININLLCNYMGKRYGTIPNIIYRLITVLYNYIFEILPDIYMFFLSVYKMVYPYIIYVIIDRYFETKKFQKSIKNKKIELISGIIIVTLILILISLISCKFKYGLLVVGSDSMTGTIDKGDAIFYERYDKQELKEGQVIVFLKGERKIIHSIEKIQIRNNEKIYLTKGTNNEEMDEGYRTNEEIMGIVKFKIIDIGWPTIWLNELFKNIV